MLKYNLSYWERETFFKDFDVAIIGSGIVGLTAALHLKRLQPRLNVVVLERGALPAGASTRNAGFACYGSMTELLDDMTRMSEDDVFAVVEKRWRGLQRLRQLVGDEPMDFEQNGGFEVFTEEEEEVFEECRDRMAHFNRIVGAITGHPQPYVVADERLADFGFRGAAHLILNQPEGQVHTGKMMARLLQLAAEAGVRIFNGIHIEQIEDSAEGVELQTAAGWTLRVPRVLVAVNGFARQLMPGIEVTPARNQVLITQPIPGLKVRGCFHYDRGYYYFRDVDGRILLGGGRHLDNSTETTSEFGPNELIRSALVQLLKTIICPGQPIEVDAWWTGILGLGPVKKPVVEQYSKNVVVAVRLSGMGVAIGTLVGEEGAERLLA
ncbi:MAG: FAD-binding oxidoreductase [Saprospiraceae bacterium]|nr:FAD-binding oxidoreductase [Saprospiraceae bacterium]MDW8229345.1 FAD-binding oxidoreductase [Saprospiraceae bacterium]